MVFMWIAFDSTSLPKHPFSISMAPAHPEGCVSPGWTMCTIKQPLLFQPVGSFPARGWCWGELSRRLAMILNMFDGKNTPLKTVQTEFYDHHTPNNPDHGSVHQLRPLQISYLLRLKVTSEFVTEKLGPTRSVQPFRARARTQAGWHTQTVSQRDKAWTGCETVDWFPGHQRMRRLNGTFSIWAY